ncbi:MAG: transporter [Acidobacteria bacterium]|nr:transporter [Acidobacteriota bacterium]
MIRLARGGLLALALLALGRGAAAQPAPAPLVTDRPSFTSAPTVVGAGVVQIETGLTAERDAPGPERATRFSVPNTLVRLGMSAQLELRVETEGWIRSATGRPGLEAVSSASDTSLALEYQFARADERGVDVAVIAGSSLPTGGAASSGNADPFARLVWGRPLGATTVVGGTFNWSAPSVASERLRALDASLVMGHPLWGAWSAFWEGVVQHRNVELDGATWLANAGVQRGVGAHLQLDAWVGRGLNDVAIDWRGGAGLSWRYRR